MTNAWNEMGFKTYRQENGIRVFHTYEKRRKADLIEQIYAEVNQKLHVKVVQFTNECHYRKISLHGAQYCQELLSDREEADTALVALVKCYE